MSSKKRILLVDDEPGILQALRLMLTSDECSVETAWSSEEALGLIKAERFDLVLTDFNMPGMKGDELAFVIKELWKGTPVLMLSGSAEILRKSGRDLSAVDVLIAKPFHVVELRREVARLMAGSASSVESRELTVSEANQSWMTPRPAQSIVATA